MASLDEHSDAQEPNASTSDTTRSSKAATQARRRWMSVLAKSSFEEISAHTADLTLPAFTWLRRPETGAVMVRGRTGGTGSAFNMGEITVTRCTLRLDSGSTGHAYVQGRDARHAELAALLDALLQDPEQSDALEVRIVAPIELAQRRRREERSRKANATKVEFFTLVRGENPK